MGRALSKGWGAGGRILNRAVRLSCLTLLLGACSPVYVVKSASGHAKLLWGRRSIDQALGDPATSESRKEKLKLVSEARRFAFERIQLKASRDYSTYAEVPGPYLTFAVSGCRKTRFERHEWWFPFLGSVPYKGYFNKKDALREKEKLESRGYDAYAGGVRAYNTPLWLSDPVPSTVLDEPAGELAALIIHELAHGTVFFKNQIAFDEALATFIGEQGAREFIAEKYGSGSRELTEFERTLERESAFTKIIDATYGELNELYESGEPEDRKLVKREEIFKQGLERLKGSGFALEELNNAVILAHRLYRDDLDLFRRAYESRGRDWKKAMALFSSLDRKAPAEDLRRRLAASASGG